jgi:hypothetical protein
LAYGKGKNVKNERRAKLTYGNIYIWMKPKVGTKIHKKLGERRAVMRAQSPLRRRGEAVQTGNFSVCASPISMRHFVIGINLYKSRKVGSMSK